MTMILIAAVAVLAVALVLALALLMRGRGRAGEQEQFDLLNERIDAAADAQAHAYERLERQLRNDITETARVSRTEQSSGFAHFQQTLAAQFSSMTTVQGGKIDGFAQQLDAVRHSLQQQAQQARDEQGRSLKQFGDTLSLQLGHLTEASDRRFAEVRATIEQRLKDIEANNASKLEEMRRTVDEKLHATLEQRLGESFKLVSDRLEQVHRGLGEMQTLAAGVGDLKKVLTNVKTRGTWGEVQLEALLEQLLTADQYAKNVATVPKSADRVEFAIRLPGRAEAGVAGAAGAAGGAAAPVWLPIDAKFPREDYERL
ncbi:DNA recombination protein RmuC, partial [Paraburkholderia graminis]|uniref:DNA recombination protein RmuC n=1 Tax=Paraburkholderia graminis TaxID=60548 RepID=UPI00389A5BBC